MPRQARLDAPGLLQHVIARGIERRAIFKDDKDRKSFLDRFAAVLDHAQTQCYAWALIPNHFHALLRTGLTPLSQVMRRLMTGYAVTFNKRHKRCGHLFQNRYKSVVCEEDAYLLELIRYIHLNPLRARLVKNLKELDKYPWTGHSALLGRSKNPLIPKRKNEPNKPDEPETTLAEKTVEDVLHHFGETVKVARRKYREFIEKGIDQGTRPDLQGGGLVRSAGGYRSSLHSQDKEDREPSDARILGSGEFVSATLQTSEKNLVKKYLPKRPMEELIELVAARTGIPPELICSGSRKSMISDARSIVAYMAVEKIGHTATEVARYLDIRQTSVLQSVRKRKILSSGMGREIN